MKARTLRHIVCGLTVTGAIFAALFTDQTHQTYGAPKPTPTPTPTPTPCPSPSPGVAPVTTPSGGFGIDGNLQADVPVSGIGDWLPSPSLSGTFVMNNSGAPVNGATTFHLIDPQNASSDNNFAGGQKVDDNPNNWTWVENPVNDKQDINNALIHFSTDANGHNWVIIAGDRRSNNGNAYIDFEFLQSPLSLTPADPNATSGGFTSAGPNCGRTVNDFLLTVSFTGGGTVPGVFFSQWQKVTNKQGCTSDNGATFYDYVDACLPAGAVFAQVNGSPVSVPYGAFGSTTYAADQFAEAAVDLTAVLNNMGSCFGVEIKTIMVKTKESQSPTATIVDFITPLQVDLNFGPTCGISGSDGPLCPSSTGNTYTAPAGADSYLWSITGNGSIVGPTNGQTVSVTAGSGCGRSFTLNLTVTKSGCTKMCSKTVTVNDTTLPVIALTAGPSGGTTPLGCNPTAAAIEAAFGTASATDDCSGNLTPTPSDSAVTSTGCSRSKTRTWTATDACNNQATATRTVTWKVDSTPPVITPSAGTNGGTTNLGCNPTNTAIDTGLGTASATDDCSGSVTPIASDSGVTFNGCNRSKTRTWTATDDCNNQATATRGVTWTEDTTPPTITATGTPSDGVLGCNPTAAQIEAALGSATATDDCGSVTPIASTGNVMMTGCSASQIRTWNVTDACGNAATAVSRTATWTVDTQAPVITLSGGKACGGMESRMCATTPPTFPTATATDNCNGDLGQPLDNPNPVPTTRPLFYFVDTMPQPNTFVRTWHAIDSCGGAGSSGHEAICSYTITCQPCNPVSACTPPYPFTSSNPKTNIAFNESTVLRKVQASVVGTGNCTPNQIQVFYNDEHSLTLGVNQISVKTLSGTTTTNCDVTPFPSPAPSPSGTGAHATNPFVGLTSGGGTPSTTCSQGDVDTAVPAGRPMYPALFVTDVTNNPNSLAGDWQSCSNNNPPCTGIPPNDVFGTWKPAAVLVDQTHNPPVTKVTPGPDTVKNNWNLGPGSDPVPSPTPSNEGFGAEVRWNVSQLKTTTPDQSSLVSGHTYRIYVMVHDGDQNQSGGDSGQACVFLTIP